MEKAVLLVCVTLTACALTSKYKLAQHAIYARLLSDDERKLLDVNEKFFKNLQLTSQSNGDTIQGTLRILKGEKLNKYVFIEIGDWYEHASFYSNGRKRGEAITKNRIR